MKYEIILTSAFKQQLKTIKKRHKKLDKLKIVVDILSRGEQLDIKYRDILVEIGSHSDLFG